MELSQLLYQALSGSIRSFLCIYMIKCLILKIIKYLDLVFSIGRMVEAMGDIELQSLQCRIHEADVEVHFTSCVWLESLFICSTSTLVYFITAMVFCLCICKSSSPHGVLIINSGSGCSPCVSSIHSVLN